MELPKPFRAQKITNGNANEVITNFLIKTGTTIQFKEEEIRDMVKNGKSFNGEKLINNPIIYHDEENNKITFSNRRLYDRFDYFLRNDMIKNGYTFTCSDKQLNNAAKEIYIRTMNLNFIK